MGQIMVPALHYVLYPTPYATSAGQLKFLRQENGRLSSYSPVMLRNCAHHNRPLMQTAGVLSRNNVKHKTS